MIAMAYDLSQMPSPENISRHPENGSKFFPKRLIEISPEYETKIDKALHQMDFKPPFNIQQAHNWVENGDYFIILENDNEIIGWRWAAVNRVFFEEFNCYIDIKKGHVFSYNAYIKKDYRRKKLNQLLLGEMLKILKNDGYNKIWSLTHKWNHASLGSQKKMGYKEIGSYFFAIILFMNFKFPPRGV